MLKKLTDTVSCAVAYRMWCSSDPLLPSLVQALWDMLGVLKAQVLPVPGAALVPRLVLTCTWRGCASSSSRRL